MTRHDPVAMGSPATAAAIPRGLDDWLEAGKPTEAAVLLPGDAELAEYYADLVRLPRLIIEFPAFMDGRGFSHARKLRQLGFSGELLASGDLLPDQWQFLQRCGFDGLLEHETASAAQCMVRFSEAYQSDQREPRPLFRRRPRGNADVS